MSIAKVSWEAHPTSQHHERGLMSTAGEGDLVGFVTDPMGEAAGCVVTAEGRIAVIRLAVLKFEGWPE